MPDETIVELPLEKFRCKKQIRSEFDEALIAELATSMKELGQLVPVLGYEEENKVIIEDGERRFLAAKFGNIRTLKAIVKHTQAGSFVYCNASWDRDVGTPKH